MVQMDVKQKPKGYEEEAVERILNQVDPDISSTIYFMPEQYRHVWDVAKSLSDADIIPAHYQKKPANVFIALMRAKRMNIDPFWFMEQTYVVHGKLGCQGKLIIALMNKSKLFQDSIRFEYSGVGETRACRAIGTLKSGKDVSFEVSYKMAKDNGWADPEPKYEWVNGQRTKAGTSPSKWQTLTDLMLAYRSAKFLGDTHCPEVIGGLVTMEEIEDSQEPGKNERPENVRVAIFDKKPEQPEPAPVSAQQPASPAPEPKQESVTTPEPGPTNKEPLDQVLEFLKTNNIDRERFNSWLISRKTLQPGEDIASASSAAILGIVRNTAMAKIAFQAWEKNGGAK